MQELPRNIHSFILLIQPLRAHTLPWFLQKNPQRFGCFVHAALLVPGFLVASPRPFSPLPKVRLAGAAVIKINKGFAVNSPSLSLEEIVIGRKNLGQTCILCNPIETNRALGDGTGSARKDPEKQAPKLQTSPLQRLQIVITEAIL